LFRHIGARWQYHCHLPCSCRQSSHCHYGTLHEPRLQGDCTPFRCPDHYFRGSVVAGPRAELQSLANGTTFSEIPLHKLACVPIPVPPVSEQLAIVHHIDGATTKLDKAIDAAHREIDLLREYRTRLIADVVTGKLDVRDAATHLPDELEEQSEPLDEEPADDAADLESEEEGNGEQTES